MKSRLGQALTYVRGAVDRVVSDNETSFKKAGKEDINITSVSVASGIFPHAELIGSTHNLVRHPDMPPAVFELMWSYLKAGQSWMGVVEQPKPLARVRLAATPGLSVVQPVALVVVATTLVSVRAKGGWKANDWAKVANWPVL